MTSNGIYVTNGPNWARDRAIIMADGPQSLKDNIGTMDGLSSVPIQATAAYA